jgi:hypothetical protein
MADPEGTLFLLFVALGGVVGVALGIFAFG